MEMTISIAKDIIPFCYRAHAITMVTFVTYTLVLQGEFMMRVCCDALQYFNRRFWPTVEALGDSAYISSDFPFVVTSDILVLKLISVLVFILFSSQNFYFI